MTPPPDAVAETMHANALVAIIRFLRVAWYRKGIVIVSFVISAALGALYYATADRRYPASASVLILQPHALAANLEGDIGQRDLMPTYQKLVTSEKVMVEAIKRLQTKDRVDLAGVVRRKWPSTLGSRVSVKSVRLTNILEISYQSSRRETAAAVVNAVVSAYIDFMDRTHQQTAHELLQVLTREKVQLEQKLYDKEQELLQAQQQARVMQDNGTSWNVLLKRAEALNTELMIAQKRRLEIESSLAALDVAIRRGDDLTQHAVAVVDSVGLEFVRQKMGFSSQDVYAVARTQLQLNDDLSLLSSLMLQYGQNHPKVTQLQDRIQTSRNFLANLKAGTGETNRRLQDAELGPMLMDIMRQKYAQAYEQEQRMRRDFDQEQRKALGLNGELARIELLNYDIKRMRNAYDVLLDQIKTVDMSKQNDSIRATIISEPQIPTVAVWPRLQTVAGMVFCLGLGIGFGVIYLLDLLDDRFRTPEELQLQLRVQILAMVRQMTPLRGTGLDTLYTYAKPNGVESEAFRTLRTALGFSTSESQRLIVSSSEPGDGKTTVMCNLAVAFAQSGKRTLLIDADMRRPGSTNLFELRSGGGLSNVLRSALPIADAVQPLLQDVGLPKLHFLPSGPRPANPTELLANERMSDLLAWAETRYDQILIDAPPILACSDAAIIGQRIDGVVLVVRPDKNRRRVVIRAVESLNSAGIPLCGLVVNHLTPQSGNDYYGYGYGYGYGSDEHDEPTLALDESDGAELRLSDLYQRQEAAAADLDDDAEHQAA